jgi:hypothetical protein
MAGDLRGFATAAILAAALADGARFFGSSTNAGG